MEVLHRCCCGLDVHKDPVVACLLRVRAEEPRGKEVRTFGTTTEDLLALADWLRAAGGAQVAMESTGVYVRRFTARAIPPAGRTGSEGHLWANDSPGGESQGGQEHVVAAGQGGRRVGPGPARPVCYGESLVA